MVIYDLACTGGHRFEGWFDGLEAYEAQHAQGRLCCPVCGTAEVRKQVSGCAVKRTTDDKARSAPPERASSAAKASPGQLRELMGTLAAHLRAASEDVGAGFAGEARKIHHGEAAERMIRGTTTAQEEQEFLDEEIPFIKLPDFSDD